MRLEQLLRQLFGRQGDTPKRVTVPGSGAAALPDSANEPVQICSPKVLLVILDPHVSGAPPQTLSAAMGWRRPDDLVRRFIAEVLQASGGLVRYRIAERIEFNEFPDLADGFRYDAAAHAEVLRRAVPPHTPSGIDYPALLRRLDVLRRIEARQLDEVWVMGFPHAGLYESVMGGAGAFWCNAPPLGGTTACRRRFIVMGFSFERDLGEMLHSYNHRSEAIMAKVFGSLDFLAWTYRTNRSPSTIEPEQELNAFERFLLFDQIAPGKAAVGTVHHPPNAMRDYDLGNPRLVLSACHDWTQFPDFRGDLRMISSAEWGGGSEAAYQRWWMNHLPKVAGRQKGVHNNWWQYIANLDNLAA